MNEKKYKILQFIINYCLLPLALLFLLFICILILSTKSHAASDHDYFPMYQNYNGKFTEEMKTAIGNRFDSENNYIFVKWYNYQYNRNYCYVLWFPKDSNLMVYGEKNNNLFEFSLYAESGIFPTSNIRSIEIPNDARYINEYSGFNLSVFSGQSSNYSSNVDYVSNFRLVTNNTSSALPVLLYTGDPDYDDPNNDTYPNNFDKPNISDYFNSDDFPSFDGSSVENAINSLWQQNKYVYGTLIPNLLNYIIDSLNWGLQKVINNIRNVMQDVVLTLQGVVEDSVDLINGFLSDIKDFVSDIKSNITYLVEPLSLSEVNVALTSSNAFGIYTDFNSFFTTFDTVFNNTSEPNSLIIPIHIENISLFYNFGCRSPILLDLSQYGDFRTPIRAFCWVFVSFGAVFLTENQLSMWLQGGSSSSGSSKGGG